MNRNAHFRIFVLSLALSTFFQFQPSLGFAAVQNHNPSILKRLKSRFLRDPNLEKAQAESEQKKESMTILASRLPGPEQALQDSPSNVSLMTSKDLSEKHPLTFQDAIRHIEGATFYDTVGSGVDQTFSLRGFTRSRDITFLLDGVRVNEVDGGDVVYPLLDMNNMDSIQVTRGSASPIYGSGAFAGIVNLKTRQASEKPLSLFGGAEWSSFRGYNFHQGMSGTLDDKVTSLGGKWEYYFDGGRNENDGFRSNGDSQITNFDIKTAYRLPEDRARIHGGVKHVQDMISNPGEMTSQQFADGFKGTNKPLDGRRYEATIAQVGSDVNFLDQRLTSSILGSWRFNRADVKTTFGTFTDFPDGWDPDTNLVVTKSTDKNLSWQAAYEDKWGWLGSSSLAGLEYRDGFTQGTQRDAFGGIIQEQAAIETDRQGRMDDFGIFWRETLKLWDRVNPFFGVRHDWNKMKTRDFITPANNIKKEWYSATISSGLSVDVIKDWQIFGNYSQGFRVPTVDEVAPFAGAVSTQLQPEKSDSYEIGSRLNYHDVAAFKSSYFLTDLKDEIVFDANSITATTPFGRNINIGKSRRYGIESRFDLKLIQELSVFGAYTWLQSYVRETSSTGSPVDGRTIGQIPENQFSWGFMSTPLKRLGAPFETLKFGLDGRFTGGQHPQSFESASQATLNATGGGGHWIKNYSLWNLILSYTWREKELYLRVNNLFDERYYSRSVTATSFGTSIYPSGTYNFVVPGAPREFVIGTKWEF